MNRKNRIRKTLMLFPLFLSLLILPEIGTAVSLSTSTHPAPDNPELRPIASCGSISYQSIQDAINHAPRNASVIIAPGRYTELLTINKTLTLIGECPETTLLAPASPENSYAIKIIAEGVTLANLSLCNTAPGMYTTGIKIMRAHTTITNCVIRDTPIGIAIWSSYTMIAHCTFHNCSDEGIALLGSNTSACSNTHITACVFSENGDGIELQRSSDNLISDCRFLNNTHAGIDMIVSANTKNSVTGCRFIANQGFGMYCAGASNLQVTDCAFSSDSIMLVNTKGSIISGSDVAGLQLLRNTTVIIDRCDTVDASRISTQTSQYLLLSSSSQMIHSNRHPLRGIVLTLTSRLQILRLLATHLTQLRM
jgi:parallel beta-helix repeat protein